MKLVFNGRMGIFATVLMAAAAAAVGGCNQVSREERDAFTNYQTGNYAQAVAVLRPAAQKKDNNYVLSNCRLGSAALAAGGADEAEQAFLNAYEIINSTNINDPGRQLGTVALWEGVKVWKGEPFEQAMAHYYLGMIYLLHHDYGNARAAFENSLFKVREYASKDDIDKYQLAESNFALGYLGLGFCNLRLGKNELAAAAFQRAQQIDSSLAQLISDVQQPNVNTLIFVDAGMGPQKAGKGWYTEESAFGPTPAEIGPILPVTATVNGTLLTRPNVRYATVDTLAMAQEKRWQDIDTIKKVKAVAGTGLMAGGAGAAAYGAAKGDKGWFWGGVGAMAAGALLSASSQSDLRAWGMLPRTVYIIPAVLPPGQHTIEVQSGAAHSAPLTVTVAPPSQGPRDNIFYFRLIGVYR